MDKLIPVLVVLGIILCGFISKIIELRRISLRIDFTHDYREKFIKYVNEIYYRKLIIFLEVLKCRQSLMFQGFPAFLVTEDVLKSP